MHETDTAADVILYDTVAIMDLAERTVGAAERARLLRGSYPATDTQRMLAIRDHLDPTKDGVASALSNLVAEDVDAGPHPTWKSAASDLRDDLEYGGLLDFHGDGLSDLFSAYSTLRSLLAPELRDQETAAGSCPACGGTLTHPRTPTGISPRINCTNCFSWWPNRRELAITIRDTILAAKEANDVLGDDAFATEDVVRALFIDEGHAKWLVRSAMLASGVTAGERYLVGEVRDRIERRRPAFLARDIFTIGPGDYIVTGTVSGTVRGRRVARLEGVTQITVITDEGHAIETFLGEKDGVRVRNYSSPRKSDAA